MKSLRSAVAGVAVIAAAAAIWTDRAAIPGETVRPPAEIWLLASQNTTRARIALTNFDLRRLNTEDSPWLLMHGLLGHSGDFRVDTPDRGSASCLAWMLGEASWRPGYMGLPILSVYDGLACFTPNPDAVPAAGMEGHFCQGLYNLSWCGIDPEAVPVRLPPDGEPTTLSRLIEDAQTACDSSQDVSWALPVFIRWGRTANWHDRFGRAVNLDVLLNQHLSLESRCGACFGAHWRMALAIAVRESPPRTLEAGVRQRTRERLLRAVEGTKKGMLKTGQFAIDLPETKDPAFLPQDEASLCSHQAHTLEWLLVALDDESFWREEWIHVGTAHLLDQLDDFDGALPYAAHAHAAHALRMYLKRHRSAGGVEGGISGLPQGGMLQESTTNP